MNRDFLEEEYIVNHTTVKEIARKSNRSITQVHYWLRKYGIARRPAGGSSKTIDLTNQRFDKLLVLNQIRGDGDCAKWLCRCDCGNLTEVKSPHLRRKEIKSCGKCHARYDKKFRTKLCNIRFGAKNRNLSFNVTITDLWNLYIKQEKRCALSGLDISFEDNTASLDRIDSKRGYEVDNVQWLHKEINQMKWDFTEKRFLELCKIILQHKGIYGSPKEINGDRH